MWNSEMGYKLSNIKKIDPIEPPPQGDVELSYVRGKYGKYFTLFGNLEASDLENLAPGEFEKKIVRVMEALCKGCGACSASCRCGAITLRGFTDEQIMAEISAL